VAGPDDIGGRKADHLDLCATDEVAYRDRTTLLEHVRLVHQSLPDLALDDVDTSVELLGKTLRAPIVIAGMTGGTERAGEVNRSLAVIAQKRGYAFGLGSQRAMERSPDTAWTYRVREHAPDVLLFGNVGVVQAREWETSVVRELVQAIGADALCLHMNPAMELIQPGGDRDFRGGTETFARLVRELGVPVIAKETGNGVSTETACKLYDAGVRVVDVSGAGGTSWVGVETLRAEGDAHELGRALWDWGIPTAASVHLVTQSGMTAIATGGIRTGHDVARALALGATAAGIARHVYMALQDGGTAAAERLLDGIERELRAVMLLSGARTIAELKRAPRVITGELRAWMGL
jgi:isopentenyl-diphosphate delta-isomerase